MAETHSVRAPVYTIHAVVVGKSNRPNAVLWLNHLTLPVMSRFFTLLLTLLCVTGSWANAPTLPSSNLQYNNIEGNRIQFNFTVGNGNSRIVVMKMGSPVTGLPVNGVSYTANNSFGTAGTEFGPDGEFVVYKGTGSVFAASNLQPYTTYYISIFELNGSGTATEYLTIALSGQQSTAVAPATQASQLVFSQIAGSSVRLQLTAGSGSGRLVLIRKGAPVNATPSDLQAYNPSTDYGSGSAINGDNYVLFNGNGTVFTVNNLEPNSTYHFAVFERNGNSAPVYKSPAAVASQTTHAGPTLPTTSIVFSFAEGNRLTISLARGNGSRRLVIGRKAVPVSSTATNGQIYTANAAFGSGQELAPGEFVLFSGAFTGGTVTNLEPDATYYFRVIEYDQDSDGNTFYMPSGKDASGATATTPPDPGPMQITNITGGNVNISFAPMNGNYRLVLAKDGAPVDMVPENMTRYSGNTSFGSSTQWGAGNYVLSGGTNGNGMLVTNLQPGHTYHLAMYEFSGNNYPVYTINASRITVTIPFEPNTAASNFNISGRQGNQFRAQWTNGNGARRLVLARKGAAVTALPADGSNYVANSNFGQGQELLPGQFVVYDGTNPSVLVDQLEPGTSYHFAVFEYNTVNGAPDYLSSTFLAGSASTWGAPDQQVSSITTGSIQSNSASFTYTPGNGEYQLFVMRQGQAVDAAPTDLLAYSTNTVLGNAALSPGQFLVHKGQTGASFTVSNLQPGTTYYLTAFGFNGSSGPVYARPGYSIQFTTAGSAPTLPPGTPSTAGSLGLVEGNSLKFDWTVGDGAKRLVVARAGAPVDFVPQDATEHPAQAAWGGSDLGNGQYAVYNGNSSTVTLTNLLPGTVYHFAVFEYNGSGSNTRYLTQQYLAYSASTSVAPSTPAGNSQLTVLENSALLQWQNGNGQRRLVVLRAGAAVSQLPVNLTAYPAQAGFGNGSQIGAGEFVVFAGTGNQVNITGLASGQTYHYIIFEYNGSAAPVYQTSSSLSGSFTTGGTLPVQWLYFEAARQNHKIQLRWGTASESDNAYFVVERANDQGAFVAVDSIPGAGNSDQARHYQFTDDQRMDAALRYRIRQVDIDGRFSYSAVRRVAASNESDRLSLYPNPVADQLTISLPGQQTINVVVYDMSGKVRMRTSVSNGQSVSTRALPPGQYLVEVTGTGVKKTARFIRM